MKEKAFVGDGGVVWSENSLEEKYSFFFFLIDGMNDYILTGGDRTYKARLCKMARILESRRGWFYDSTLNVRSMSCWWDNHWWPPGSFCSKEPSFCADSDHPWLLPSPVTCSFSSEESSFCLHHLILACPRWSSSLFSIKFMPLKNYNFKVTDFITKVVCKPQSGNS